MLRRFTHANDLSNLARKPTNLFALTPPVNLRYLKHIYFFLHVANNASDFGFRINDSQKFRTA